MPLFKQLVADPILIDDSLFPLRIPNIVEHNLQFEFRSVLFARNWRSTLLRHDGFSPTFYTSH